MHPGQSSAPPPSPRSEGRECVDAEHNCYYEKDHDGGMTCPVCGRYEGDDEEDE